MLRAFAPSFFFWGQILPNKFCRAYEAGVEAVGGVSTVAASMCLHRDSGSLEGEIRALLILSLALSALHWQLKA